MASNALVLCEAFALCKYNTMIDYHRASLHISGIQGFVVALATHAKTIAWHFKVSQVQGIKGPCVMVWSPMATGPNCWCVYCKASRILWHPWTLCWHVWPSADDTLFTLAQSHHIDHIRILYSVKYCRVFTDQNSKWSWVDFRTELWALPSAQAGPRVMVDLVVCYSCNVVTYLFGTVPVLGCWTVSSDKVKWRVKV